MRQRLGWAAAGLALVGLVTVGAVAYVESDDPQTEMKRGKRGKKKRAKRGKRPPRQAAPSPAAGKPNVLVVLWDTVRADRLTLYNEDLPTTPRMAEWAWSGVVYERAISPAMWTVPSHASLFTGLPPTSHGAGEDHRWLDGHHTTLAEWLGQHGYDTYAFSANPNLSPDRVNLLQGIEHIDTSWKRPWRRKVVRNARSKLLKEDRSTEISPAFEDEALTNRPFTFNAAPVAHEAFTKWLDTRGETDAPWFAYLSYMEAHKPRIPRMESRRRVADDELVALSLQTDLSFRSQLFYSYGRKEYSDRELEAINRVYDATLVDLDEATGDLLDDLRASGHLDNTVVVFTSDHGELLGEHHLFGHRHSIYQSLVHVPLVIAWPGKLEPRRVKEAVSNLDLFHTVLELAELPKPEHPYSRGDLLTAPNNARGVFTEQESIDRLGWKKISAFFSDLDQGPWLRKYRGLVADGWKLIRDSNGAVELYHLDADPHEEHDLSGQNPDRAAELATLLDEYVAAMPAYDADRQEAEPVDDAETRAQLALLGYLDEEEAESESEE